MIWVSIENDSGYYIFHKVSVCIQISVTNLFMNSSISNNPFSFPYIYFRLVDYKFSCLMKFIDIPPSLSFLSTIIFITIWFGISKNLIKFLSLDNIIEIEEYNLTFLILKVHSICMYVARDILFYKRRKRRKMKFIHHLTSYKQGMFSEKDVILDCTRYT